MNIKQIKRLFLILSVPFVGFGFWLDEQSIFKDYPQVYCGSYGKNFTCFTSLVEREHATHPAGGPSGVILLNDVKLTTGFNEKVITTGVNEIGLLPDGTFGVKRVVGAGVEKVLRTDAYLASGLLHNVINRNCNLRPHHNNGQSGEWSLSCGDEISENFRFLDSATTQKYNDLENLVKAELGKYPNSRYYSFVASMLLAPLVLLLMLAVAALLMKAVSFIRYGRKI